MRASLFLFVCVEDCKTLFVLLVQGFEHFKAFVVNFLFQLKVGVKRLFCRDKLLDFVKRRYYAQAYAHDKLRYERWGRQKIRQGLAAKRIPEADIRAALDELDEEEYRTILGEVVRRKLAATTAETDFQRNQKVARYAISRGFEPALVFPLVGSTDPFEE